MATYETLIIVLKKKCFITGIAIISALLILGALAEVLTPFTPRSVEIVASDFAVPEWAGPPDVPRNIIKNFTEFTVIDKKVNGSVEFSVTSAECFKLEIRGEGQADISLVSSDYIFYPYKPARRAQIDIIFNASYLEGAGEAWYNVDVFLFNEDLVERGEKLSIKIELASGEDYKIDIPKGIYSVYDLVTTKMMPIYKYHRGVTISRTRISLPNSIRNMKQRYIIGITDPQIKEATIREFSLVNALRDLILEKNTKIRVLVNITYY
ncbi:MAG: hypothetical protein QXY49_05970, partial [Thermofilaceae archaeon]